MSNLRILRLTGTVLDGTTPLTTDWNPDPPGNRSQGESWALQTTVGRISPLRWMSRGSLGAIVIAKAWQTQPDGPVTLTSRTPTGAELAELSPPANLPTVPPNAALNQPLESRTVNASTWSAPLLLSPEHALTLTQPGDNPAGPAGNTVEMIFIDIGSAEALAYIQAIFGACCSDGGGGEVQVRTVTVSEAIPAFAGTEYLLVNGALSNITLTLPAVASVTEGTTLVATRIGGGVPTIIPATGETINGDVDGRVVINDIGQATFVLRGGQWLSSVSPQPDVITVTNAIAGGVVALPLSTGSTRVIVNFTANGILRLPVLADAGDGIQYIIAREQDGPAQPARVQVLPQGGELLNGVTNLAAYLAEPGSAIRIIKSRAGAGTATWQVVSDRQALASQTLALAASTVLDSGVPSPKQIRATLATFQTITLPAAAVTAVGTNYRFTFLGAAGGAIADGGSAIVSGGALLAAGTLQVRQNDTIDLTFDGTNWHAIYGATVPQVVTAAVNTVIAQSWTGIRIYRCTQAAAQSLDLPAPGVCKVGMELQVVGTGGGGLTVNGGGANIISAGATAASLALAANTPARLIFDGTDWQRT